MAAPKFIRTAGRVQVLDGTRKVFDTELLPASLATPAAITLSNYSISFPDLVKDNSYYHDSSHSSTTRTENYAGFITAVPQEWGPSGKTGVTNVLADIVLGTVPAGTDYLDVELTINSRSNAPTAILGDTLDPIIPVGKQTQLLGGSAPLEEAASFARGFAIVLSGTSVLLRRYQSVSADDKKWSASNSPANSGFFTYGSVKGTEFYILPGSGSSTSTASSDQWQRGSANQIANIPLTDVTDYSSTYNVDLVITPGFFNTDPTVHPSATKSCIRLGSYDYRGETNVGASLTFSGAFLGVPDASRRVIVAIAGETSAISSVTVAGVAATQIKAQASSTLNASLWLASVPSGTTGNVVVSFSSGTGNLTASVTTWALYHLSSTTPVGTASTTTSGGTASVATSNGGFAFAAEAHEQGLDSGSLSGIIQTGYDRIFDGSNFYVGHGFGTQPTTGASLSPTFSFNQFGALVAASFS